MRTSDIIYLYERADVHLKGGENMKNERIYIRVSEKEKTELKAEAEAEQMTLSEYLLNIIRLRRRGK